jgi:hypothetical protein
MMIAGEKLPEEMKERRCDLEGKRRKRRKKI